MPDATTTIVLVDDDEDDYLLTLDMMREVEHGRFDLKWAPTYEAALTTMRQAIGDVYLVDYRLGQRDGLELLHEAASQGMRAPIILLTGQGNRDVDVEAMRRGASDYLVKGEINSFILERTIRYAIERKQNEDAVRRHAAQAEALARTAARLNTRLDLENVLQAICEEAARALSLPAAAIALYDEKTEVMRYRATYGLPSSFESEALPFPRDILNEYTQDFTNLIALSDLQAMSGLPNAALFTRYDIRSLCAAALERSGRPLGVVAAFAVGSERNFTADEQILLKGIADQAAQAVANAQLYEESRRHAARAEALARTAARLNAQLDLHVVLNTMCEESARALGVPASAVMLFDPKTDELRFAAVYGLPGNFGEGTQPYSRALLDENTRLGSSVAVVPDLAAVASLPNLDYLRQHNIGGFCAAGMARGGELIGVLIACTLGQPCVFDEDEQALQQGLADQAAQAIVNVRLFEETQRRLENVQALRAIDSAITASLDLRLSLRVVFDQVIGQLRVDAVSVLLCREQLRVLEYIGGRGFRTASIQHTRLSLDDNYAGRAVLERRTIYVPDLISVAAEFGRSQLVIQENFAAYYAVPLLAKGRVNGVLEVFHRAPIAADIEWEDFLETLAGQTAIAIDNATLFNDLQRSNVELTLAYDATIEGWSRALDLRDKETEGHTLRVTEMTLRLARAMGITEDEIVHVRRGALLHDIGKMGVPDAILLKPGPLTDAEWVMMKKHPGFAYEMLSPISYLRRALDIPYCHHEKWDGTGYPRGLRGEQIPLAARLFAVVDVWDALSSDRPYRAAWPKDKVLAHIKAGSGSHFDARAVEAFLSLGV